MIQIDADETAVDRFTSALYSAADAARYLGVSSSSFRNWARGYEIRRGDTVVTGAPVVTALMATRRGDATIPFVGLAEAYVLVAMRRAGVPLQRIRPALERLDTELGIGHALASRSLYTDGAEVLYDYAQGAPGDEAAAVRELVVVRDGQRVLTEVVEKYLKRIAFGSDGYALAIPLVGYTRAAIVADSRRSFGQPIFDRSGVRVEDALAMFAAGEDLSTVAEEYGTSLVELEDVLRPLAAA